MSHFARTLALSVALLGLAVGGTPAGAADLSTADRTALLDLISRYSHTWDGRKNAEWVALFTEDAVLKASFRGKAAWAYGSNAERAKFIEDFYAGAEKTGLLQSRHFQTNTLFEAQDDGTVHAETMFAVTFQFRGEPAPRFSNTGIYRDRFVETASGWKFALRDILVDQDPPPAE